MDLREVRSVIQTDSLDDGTRVELWNVIHLISRVLEDDSRASYTGGPLRSVLHALWAWDMGRPADEQPADHIVWRYIKEMVLDGPWNEAFDIIEAVVGRLDQFGKPGQRAQSAEGWVGIFNDRFEDFLVGYRFIGLEITPIDTSEQATAISEALEATEGVPGARHHLSRAVELLADREDPDYPNSITESISAVEALGRSLTGASTLGAALKQLEAAGVPTHSALQSAWVKMYGWASDADGLRHGGSETPNVDQALAKYVLITSSAFVSYLTEKARKAGRDVGAGHS